MAHIRKNVRLYQFLAVRVQFSSSTYSIISYVCKSTIQLVIVQVLINEF